MKVLLDECVDARLAREIVGHDVWTVPQAGWAGYQDRELLEKADVDFDVLVTTDRNIEFQQNLAKYNLSVIVLRARTSRLSDLKLLVPGLLPAIITAPKRAATYV